jgi:nitroreductase
MKAAHKSINGLLVAIILLASNPGATAQDVVKLPTPEMKGGLPLMEALARRRSTRSFEDRELPSQTLSNLLWAAFGINRPESGGRTAPSWRGSYEIDIYVAMPDAVRIYDAKANELRPVMSGDIRAKTAPAPFVRNAPVVLIYVADRMRMAKASDEEQVQNAHVDAAIIGQNVYLFAASAGLGTVILGSVDRRALSQMLKLRDDQIVTYSQPVGYPK